VRLTRSGKRALGHRRSLLASLRVSATDASGNSARGRKRVRFSGR